MPLCRISFSKAYEANKIMNLYRDKFGINLSFSQVIHKIESYSDEVNKFVIKMLYEK